MILAYKGRIKELENELKSKNIQINMLNIARNNEYSNSLMQIKDLKIENKILLEQLDKAKDMYEKAMKDVIIDNKQ